MNGDGIDDLVLHDSQDGNSGVWLLGGEQPVWADLDKLSDSQSILGTGDFNGDGIDDVLIYNSSDQDSRRMAREGRQYLQLDEPRTS